AKLFDIVLHHGKMLRCDMNLGPCPHIYGYAPGESLQQTHPDDDQEGYNPAASAYLAPGPNDVQRYLLNCRNRRADHPSCNPLRPYSFINPVSICDPAQCNTSTSFADSDSA